LKITGIRPYWYLRYKFLNSLFTGLSVGSIFTIYAPLKPSIYSIGGIVLAVGMLVIAKFYEKLITIKKFFYISIFVEVVILLLVLLFILKPYTYTTALLIYSGYQITFMFGSYLLRAETLFLRKKKLLSYVDMFKQAGYLAGLVFSFLFYRGIEHFFGVQDNQTKVYLLHFLLFFNELAVIGFLFLSFKRKRKTLIKSSLSFQDEPK
jgi:hypothetical protein